MSGDAKDILFGAANVPESTSAQHEQPGRLGMSITTAIKVYS